MKRFLITLAAATFSLAAFADNSAYILSHIESLNANVKTLSARFEQTKTMPGGKVNIKSEGDFEYALEGDKFSMIYSKPAGENFIIDGKTLSMCRGGKSSKFDLTKTPSMNALANTLLYSVKGTLRRLSNEVNANIATEETSKEYIVTLTAKKKEAKGYAKIVLSYDKNSCILQDMLMEEFTGIKTEYKMLGIKKNVK